MNTTVRWGVTAASLDRTVYVKQVGSCRPKICRSGKLGAGVGNADAARIERGPRVRGGMARAGERPRAYLDPLVRTSSSTFSKIGNVNSQLIGTLAQLKCLAPWRGGVCCKLHPHDAPRRPIRPVS